MTEMDSQAESLRSCGSVAILPIRVKSQVRRTCPSSDGPLSFRHCERQLWFTAALRDYYQPTTGATIAGFSTMMEGEIWIPVGTLDSKVLSNPNVTLHFGTASRLQGAGRWHYTAECVSEHVHESGFVMWVIKQPATASGSKRKGMIPTPASLVFSTCCVWQRACLCLLLDRCDLSATHAASQSEPGIDCTMLLWEIPLAH